jgi:hypothetical protein
MNENHFITELLHFAKYISTFVPVLAQLYQFRWLFGLRHRSAAVWLLVLRVWISLHGCLSVVLSCAGRGLCDGLITGPKESYRVSVCVWSRNLNTEEGKAYGGLECHRKNKLALPHSIKYYVADIFVSALYYLNIEVFFFKVRRLYTTNTTIFLVFKARRVSLFVSKSSMSH